MINKYSELKFELPIMYALVLNYMANASENPQFGFIFNHLLAYRGHTTVFKPLYCVYYIFTV